jgi:hypothetical protein
VKNTECEGGAKQDSHGMYGDKEMVYTSFCWRNLRKTDNLEDLGIDRSCVLKKVGRRVWTGLIWLRVGTRGGLLWIW